MCAHHFSGLVAPTDPSPFASSPIASSKRLPTPPARLVATAVTPNQEPHAIYKVVDLNGAVVHAGKADFASALDLLKAGKPIRYEGVIGPVSFDKYGDITGPFRLWKIVDGKVTTTGEMTTDDVNALMAKIGK